MIISSCHYLFIFVKPGKKNIPVPPFINEDLKLNLIKCPECGRKFHKSGHNQVFSESKIRDLFRTKGFEIVDGKERVFRDERAFDYCPYCESENLYYDSNFEVYVCGSCGKVWQ